GLGATRAPTREFHHLSNFGPHLALTPPKDPVARHHPRGGPTFSIQLIQPLNPIAFSETDGRSRRERALARAPEPSRAGFSVGPGNSGKPGRLAAPRPPRGRQPLHRLRRRSR